MRRTVADITGRQPVICRKSLFLLLTPLLVTLFAVFMKCSMMVLALVLPRVVRVSSFISTAAAVQRAPLIAGRQIRTIHQFGIGMKASSCISSTRMHFSSLSREMNTKEVFDYIQTTDTPREDIVYLDVRTPDEFRAIRPKLDDVSVVNIPAFVYGDMGMAPAGEEFEEELRSKFDEDDLQGGKIFFVGCKAGVRSAHAIARLGQTMGGMRKGVNVAGGMDEWWMGGLPVEGEQA